MATPDYRRMLASALEAGSRRDYGKAEAQLGRIAAECDDLPEAWLYLGRARHAQGRHRQALPAFAAYLRRRPDDQAGWFFLGRSYLYAGRAREARRCLLGAVERGRSDASVWALLGYAELRLRRFAASVEAMEHAVAASPADQRIYRGYLNALYVRGARLAAAGASSRANAEAAAGMLDFVIANGGDGPSARLYRARAYRYLGRTAEALSDVEAAMAANPGDRSLAFQAAMLRFASGDAEGAVATLGKAGLELPDMRGAPWTAAALDRWRALAALKAGDPKSALDGALTRMRQGDEDAAIRAVAAQANYELGRYERAASHFARAAEADPKAPDLRLGQALSLWELRRYAEARTCVRAAEARGADPRETAYIATLCDASLGADPAILLPRLQALLRERPGDRRVMFLLAEALYRTGRPDLADGWFAEVLGADPANEMASLYRIAVAESLGRSEEAAKRRGEYLAAWPDNAAIRRELVESLVAAERWDEAARAIEEGFAYGSSDRSADGFLARCYRNAGRHREAAGLYRVLLRDEPRNRDFLLGLAYSLDRSGASGMALELLQKGAAYIGQDPAPWLALGVMRGRAGDKEKAAEAFLKASELDPADPRPLRNLARLFEDSGAGATAAGFRERADDAERAARGRPRGK